MPNSELNNQQLSNGVNLLISILVRYPEIGTVSFAPPNNYLTLKFMLSAIPSIIEFSTIKQLLIDSITAYTMLEGLPIEAFNIELFPYGQVAIVNIVRDINTIAKNELSLITALLRENFEKYLIIEPNDYLLEEDLLLQEEVIENMLENIKYHPPAQPLIGIRENGRVLIFNK